MTDETADTFTWPEGWCSARLGRQRAFHYYRDGKSLCGKYRVAKSQLEFVSHRHHHQSPVQAICAGRDALYRSQGAECGDSGEPLQTHCG